MRRAAQLPTLSWHGRSSAVGLPPCSLPPQDLGRVLDGGPIRHGVDSQQLVVPGSPPTACTGIQQGCQLVCPAAGTFWWCWLSPFVLHPAPPMSPHDLLLSQRLRLIPKNSTYCSYPKFFLHPQGGGCIGKGATELPSTPERPRGGPSPYISPHGLYLVETSRICAPRAARGPLSPPAENALFGSIFDFLKNTPQADLSGFEVPPGA